MGKPDPRQILLNISEIPAETIDAMSDAEAWRMVYTIQPPKPKDTRMQVCFTGFRPGKKTELTVLAKACDLKVVGSVTVKLDFLVCGENAGSAKMAKAERQGVQIMDEEQFLTLVETGEVPVSI